MESFGFWYKLVEDKDDKNPEFDLHVNFWFLGDILKGKVKNPYLEIGIKIQNYKNLSNLVFSFPFHVPQKNLVDLASKMSVKNNASIVFNEECEIETQKEYTLIKIPGKEKTDDKKLLIFPLEQAVENIYELTDYKEKSYITVKFDEFRTYLKNSGSDLERYSDIYIRFRIQNIDLENILYFDSEPFNKSLDSAFSGTRVLDFKINEKRNIDKNITARMEQKEELLVEFGQIHFLVMEPSSYDMVSYTQNQMSCRELEKDLWNEYLKVDLEDKFGHVLAYHWKKKASDQSKISDFSCFAKINYQKMQMKTVFAYVLVVLGLGVAGSTIVSATPLINTFSQRLSGGYNIVNLIMDLALAVVMIFIGWRVGRSK